MQILKLARIHRVSRLPYYFRLIINCYEGMSYDWLIWIEISRFAWTTKYMNYTMHAIIRQRIGKEETTPKGKTHFIYLFIARRVKIF